MKSRRTSGFRFDRGKILVIRTKKGDNGDPGLAGPKGDPGLAGSKGDPGLSGLKGDIGLIGLSGPKGDTGLPGLTGLKGDIGLIGPKGNPAPTILSITGTSVDPVGVPTTTVISPEHISFYIKDNVFKIWGMVDHEMIFSAGEVPNTNVSINPPFSLNLPENFPNKEINIKCSTGMVTAFTSSTNPDLATSGLAMLAQTSPVTIKMMFGDINFPPPPEQDVKITYSFSINGQFEK